MSQPTVRAKFRVIAVTRRKGTVWNGDKAVQGEIQSIEMLPVTGGSDENQRFWASTPSGKIELGTVNPEAGNRLVLDGEYYVDFTPAT